MPHLELFLSHFPISICFCYCFGSQLTGFFHVIINILLFSHCTFTMRRFWWATIFIAYLLLFLFDHQATQFFFCCWFALTNSDEKKNVFRSTHFYETCQPLSLIINSVSNTVPCQLESIHIFVSNTVIVFTNQKADSNWEFWRKDFFFNSLMRVSSCSFTELSNYMIHSALICCLNPFFDEKKWIKIGWNQK